MKAKDVSKWGIVLGIMAVIAAFVMKAVGLKVDVMDGILVAGGIQAASAGVTANLIVEKFTGKKNVVPAGAVEPVSGEVSSPVVGFTGAAGEAGK